MAKQMAITKMFASLISIVHPTFKPNKYSPLLQIYDTWEARDTQTNAEQFRLILADGYDLQHPVLAPELNEIMKSGLVKKGSIVRVLIYTLHKSIHHELKRLIKIHNLEFLATNFSIIGQSLDYLTNWPSEEGMKFNEQDWDEHNWEWLDPKERKDCEEDDGEEQEPLLTLALTPDAVIAIDTNIFNKNVFTYV